MNDQKVGLKIGDMDAIHVGFVVVSCDVVVSPGERIRVAVRSDVDGNDAWYASALHVNPNAVVDPFCDRPIRANEAFRAFIIPGVIPSFRHVFSREPFVMRDPSDPYDDDQYCHETC